MFRTVCTTGKGRLTTSCEISSGLQVAKRENAVVARRLLDALRAGMAEEEAAPKETPP